jgi:hypothetical protein
MARAFGEVEYLCGNSLTRYDCVEILKRGRNTLSFSVVNEINFASITTVNLTPAISCLADTRIKPSWQFIPEELF